MRRLSRSTSTAAALTSLLLGVPLVATAGAQVPPQAAATVKCGDTITKNTTLVADVGPCAGNGIIIGADNITLNLNGHTISGTPEPGDGNAAGVRLADRSGVTVTGLPGRSGKKGNITGFDAGVVINRSSGNTIENLNITDNVGPQTFRPLPELGDGVILFYSANNRVLNNLIARNGYYDGIGVLGEGSDNNLIQGNTVEDTLGIENRRNPSFQGNGIVTSHFLNANDPRGVPIFNNDIVDNVVRRSFTAGVSAIANHNGRIVGNTIEDNGDPDRRSSQRNGNGIGITTGDSIQFPSIAFTRMLVEGNKINRNALAGIFVNRDARENQILRNEVRGNSQAGIFMGFTRDNLIAENTALDTVMFEYSLDLFDSSIFEGRTDCAGNIWRDNIYGTVAPDCAANGTQVDSSQQVADPTSEEKANPSTDAPPPGLVRDADEPQLPDRAQAPRD